MKKHLAFVRSKPCMNCRTDQNIEAHHLLVVPGKHRGIGMKHKDEWTVPLCRKYHRSLHEAGSERLFFGDERKALDMAKYLTVIDR